MSRYTFVCSSPDHPVWASLENWIAEHPKRHDMTLLPSLSDIDEDGEVLFLVSCTQLAGPSVRARFAHTLVFHASDLPKGRGWSPQVWDVLSGADHLTLCMLEAADKVDAGRIWARERIAIPKTALSSDINDALASAILQLAGRVIEDPAQFTPTAQTGEPTFHRRRKPDDSRLDPNQSIAAQWNLIRVCDPQRYPAFFDLHGTRYRLTIEKDEPGGQ